MFANAATGCCLVSARGVGVGVTSTFFEGTSPAGAAFRFRQRNAIMARSNQSECDRIGVLRNELPKCSGGHTGRTNVHARLCWATSRATRRAIRRDTSHHARATTNETAGLTMPIQMRVPAEKKTKNETFVLLFCKRADGYVVHVKYGCVVHVKYASNYPPPLPQTPPIVRTAPGCTKAPSGPRLVRLTAPRAVHTPELRRRFRTYRRRE